MVAPHEIDRLIDIHSHHGTAVRRGMVRGMRGLFRLDVAQDGPRRYWLAQGELGGERFEVPDGNLDVSFARASLVDVDFSRLRFSRFLAYDSVFERCDFTKTRFDELLLGAAGSDGMPGHDPIWPVTLYRECVFAHTRPRRDTPFGNARFERCVFDDAGLRSLVSPYQAQFVECTFRGRIQNMQFWGKPSYKAAVIGRDRNAFTGNDFTGAELVRVGFKYVDLMAQRFPGLPDYAVLDRVDQRVEAALADMSGWPVEIKRKAARSMRTGADYAVRQNNGYALVSRDWIGNWQPADARDQIFWMLVNYSDNAQASVSKACP
jgi:uncharacterized protein YjbI with pentapeptide repeats